MSDMEPAKRFSPVSFALTWVVLALLTWGFGCLLALVLMYNELDSGLVPVPLLLGLALGPVSVATLVIQSVLYMTGRRRWLDSPGTCRLLLYAGTPLLTLLCLWLLMFLLGGAGSFLPRI